MKNGTTPCYIVGIDPGKRGAIAFVKEDFSMAQVYCMPKLDETLIDFLISRRQKILLVAIEKQQPFPKQGVKSMFSLGFNYGILIGILKTLQIPYEEIPPRRWQKEMLGNGRKKRGESKKLSLKKAKALFPYLAENIGKHHGKSDALLIAEYARRYVLGKNE